VAPFLSLHLIGVLNLPDVILHLIPLILTFARGGEHFIRMTDMASEVTIPKTKIHNFEREDKPLCPKTSPIYINEKDNTLLCRRVVYSDRDFPFGIADDDIKTETIPVFWSGSSSFETFLRADFYEDRFVVNAMTATDNGVSKYVDVKSVPNPVHPYHEPSELEETVIFL
jgi:hypothetical protein